MSSRQTICDGQANAVNQEFVVCLPQVMLEREYRRRWHEDLALLMERSKVLVELLLKVGQHVDRATGLDDRHRGITFLAGHGGKVVTRTILERANDILSRRLRPRLKRCIFHFDLWRSED